MGLGPLPSVPNMLRLALNGAGDIYKWANILHFAYTGGPPSVANLVTLATDIGSLWQDHVAPLVTADNSLFTTKLTDLSSDTGAQVDVSTGVDGTNGEDPIPNNVATLITYPVDRRFRGGHPRTYLNAGGAGNQESGSVTDWNSGYLTEVANGWGAFTDGVSALSAGGVSLGAQCCIQYLHDGAYLTPPIVLTLPTFEVSTSVASQRRRVGRK
jgi:hypothetical protein